MTVPDVEACGRPGNPGVGIDYITKSDPAGELRSERFLDKA
jgi:hypothetical protein